MEYWDSLLLLALIWRLGFDMILYVKLYFCVCSVYSSLNALDFVLPLNSNCLPLKKRPDILLGLGAFRDSYPELLP